MVSLHANDHEHYDTRSTVRSRDGRAVGRFRLGKPGYFIAAAVHTCQLIQPRPMSLATQKNVSRCIESVYLVSQKVADSPRLRPVAAAAATRQAATL